MEPSGPRCPNHQVPLEDLQRTGPGEGVGICPISGCHFEYKADDNEAKSNKKIDKFGNIKKSDYTITPLDGEGG